MDRPAILGRLVNWSVELGEHQIEYRPRTSIKAQALADFIAETTRLVELNEEVESEQDWKIYVDGSSTKKKSRVGVVLITPNGTTFSLAMKFSFKALNNESEYDALLAGLSLAKSIGVQKIHIFSDSQLMINQIKETFKQEREIWSLT